MSKEELFKKCNEIMLETNGGVDDYVVALCRLSNLIQDYAEENCQRIAELEGEIKKTKEDLAWYSMWHKNFNEQINELTSELEIYRPTKLTGDGQCSCYGCEQKQGFNRHWTNSCYRYKGLIYCSECLKEVLDKEQNIELERLQKDNAKLIDRLKNVIAPKFKVGQEVYYIKGNTGIIKPAEILEIRYNGKKIIYELEYLDNIQEETYIFATEIEAQKYLENVK